MGRRRFIALLGILACTPRVVGKNDFNPSFPTTFSFNATTPFIWQDIKGTALASLFVVGDSDQFERFELPLDPQACVRTTIVDKVTTCTLWLNNGTATFGGIYAEKLVAGRLYHLLLHYEAEDAKSEGSSESPVFRMINPLPVPTGSGSPISTPSPVLSSQRSTSSQTAPKSPSSGSISRTSSTKEASSTTSTIPETESASPASSPTSSPYLSPSATTLPSAPNSLTPGAKVGITVGVLSVVISAFLILFFLYRKRQAKKKKKQLAQSANRDKGIDLDDIAITLGSPVTYDRVSEGRRGWHQRDTPRHPTQVPRTPDRRDQSQQELLHGSPF
ncbi:uncharacterized protein RSE6_09530 [Rhynchosporium secalis]|uniref:Uncharacterized protein n=1 Tax=Rhynchosporium secalis TaxID=38038 RepID=A0A1E1MI46_RHYSE|nr:uncharacterized protein RSE6_09530 [Rhynchosporium secalis]